MQELNQYQIVRPTDWGARNNRYEAEHILRHELPGLPAAADVLEIGPGLGYFAEICVAAGHRYQAIEPSRQLREHLREALGIDALDASVPPIPLGSEKFDLIWLNQVLEHMEGFQSALQLLNECRRVLRPAGFFCIIVPDSLYQGTHFWNADPSHGYPLTHRRLNELARYAGLEVVTNRRFARLMPDTVAAAAVRVLIGCALWGASLQITEELFHVLGKNEMLYKIQKNLLANLLCVLRRPQ